MLVVCLIVLFCVCGVLKVYLFVCYSTVLVSGFALRLSVGVVNSVVTMWCSFVWCLACLLFVCD